MQINNRFIDDLARVASGALGVAAGVRDEVEALLKARFERYLADLSMVSRDDFDAVRDIAVKARESEEKLAVRLAQLEQRVAALEAARLNEPPAGDADPSLGR
jgi:BMFP domain-containing protein YqiC